jgi:hypothetical protein
MAAVMRTALTGRTHGCTDLPCYVKILLTNSEPSTHGTSATSPFMQEIPLFAEELTSS